MFAFNGRTVTVNLSTGRIEIETFNSDFARKYIGGNGFAAKYFLDKVSSKTGPFDPDNPVIFTSGPFCDTPFTGARGHAASISPANGLFFDSNYGGDFALAFKRSGFDMLVINGKSDIPVYIVLDNGKVEIKDAKDMWGKTTSEAHEWICSREGKGGESAVIGPAGENLLTYSSIICSGKRISAAGRGGIASVMGCKKVKAVCAKGSLKTRIFNPDSAKQYMKTSAAELKEKSAVLTKMGTPFLVNMINGKGKLVTNNNRTEVFEGADKISGQLIEEKYKIKNTACMGCAIACGKLVSVPSGDFSGRKVKMPEFETLYSLGSICGNSDIVSIFNANTMCDEMGLDTISFGVTLAFLIECSQTGLLESISGLDFGDMPDMSSLVRAAAFGEGTIGELLSLGSEKLAAKIGGGSEKFLYSVKSLEIAGHSARGLRQLGLGYAVATRGGSHHDIRPQYLANDPQVDPGFEGQALYSFNSQNNTALGDSLMICRFYQERIFGAAVNQKYLPAVNSVTGWDMTIEELALAGERIYNMERLINTNRGISRKNDIYPYRILNEKIPSGPSAGWGFDLEQFNSLLDEYYKICGWDKNGVPTQKQLENLGI